MIAIILIAVIVGIVYLAKKGKDKNKVQILETGRSEANPMNKPNMATANSVPGSNRDTMEDMETARVASPQDFHPADEPTKK